MAKPPQFPLLDLGQECIIFSSGCLDLSTDLLGNMVLVRNVKYPLVASYLKGQFLFSTSAVKFHDSEAYRNIGMTREPISFTFDPRDMFLSL